MSGLNEAPNGMCHACYAKWDAKVALKASRDERGERFYCDAIDCPLCGEDFSAEEIETMEGKTLDEIAGIVTRLCLP